MEKKMETTIVNWGYILGFIQGIMERKMETTIVNWGYTLRLYRENGKDNGS